jgi:hypothetical protein
VVIDDDVQESLEGRALPRSERCQHVVLLAILEFDRAD